MDQRIWRLQCLYRGNPLDTAQLLNVKVRDTDMAHLPLFLQLCQRTPSLFNIGFRFRRVNLIEVDGLNTQTFQAGFDFSLDRGRFQASAHSPLIVPDITTLRKDIRLLAPFY